MRYMFIITLALCVGSIVLFAAESGTVIDPRQSLVVTDAAILARFPFSRTMGARKSIWRAGIDGAGALSAVVGRSESRARPQHRRATLLQRRDHRESDHRFTDNCAQWIYVRLPAGSVRGFRGRARSVRG
jgi:hypothetical protein